MMKMILLFSMLGLISHAADTVTDPAALFPVPEPAKTFPVQGLSEESKPVPPPYLPKQKKSKKSQKVLNLPIANGPTMAPRDTSGSSVSPEDVVEKIMDGNHAMKKINEQNNRCGVCDLRDQTQASGGGETRADELIKMKRQFDALDPATAGTLVEPKTDVNNTGTNTAVCGDRPGDYQACIYHGDVVPGQFRLNNKTNSPLPREWQFDFAAQARQDLGISISDYNDNHYNQSKFTYIMVFPRRYIPAIRTDGDKQIVTLPTGETVTYDTKTKKVLGGVLTDQKTYTGSNVVIKVDATGKEPRLGKGMATISKNGQSCKVPLKSLWPDQSDSSLLHFKFPTDSEFDNFLKSQKCGFSVY